MLSVAGVHAFYGNVEALKGVDLAVEAGEIVALIGANGAGKSTLLMTICGRPRARAGQHRLRRARHHLGAHPRDRPPRHLARARGPAHLPAHDACWRICRSARPSPIPRISPTISPASSRSFPMLRERQGQRGGTLSGGEQQMLAIGRALMSRPQLLLLDEPSLGLAPLVVKQIFEVIREINEQQKVTVFLVEQNAHQALRLAHRGYVMQNGTIALSGPGADVARQ